MTDTRGDEPIERLRRAIRRLAEFNRERTATGVRHDDADETVGTVASDDAFGFDPFPLLHALGRTGARVVVIGQVAAILHGSTELTGDLDLLWDGDMAQAPALAAAFARVGAVLTDESGAVVPSAAHSFALPKVLFRSTYASGDCCSPHFRGAICRSSNSCADAGRLSPTTARWCATSIVMTSFGCAEPLAG